MSLKYEPFRNPQLLFFFFITLKPRVEGYTKYVSLKYEPASEPLHISSYTKVYSVIYDSGSVKE